MSITARGVRRTFDGVEAVRHVDLEARAGRVTALIGPNGAGKTTLLLVLASLLRADAGEVRIAGFDPATQTREVRRRLGWMPDSLGAWEGLTCRQALTMTGRLYDLPTARARDRATELLDFVGLGLLADRPTRVLSRGQKQKLSLCRALVHDPEVLLLDEPASGLDPAAQLGLREHLLGLAAEGRTIVVSSHELDELEAYDPDVVFLKDGVTADRDEVRRVRAQRRVWRIEALDPAVLATALPRVRVPAFDAVVRPDGALVATFDDGRHAAAFLGAVVEAGVAVVSFAPATGELEHVFLELARGPVRPPSPPVPSPPVPSPSVTPPPPAAGPSGAGDGLHGPRRPAEEDHA